MKDVKYLYITSAPYDRGVYQTQVLDWLNLYIKNGLDFSLIQLFDLNPKTIKESKSSMPKIQAAFNGNVDFIWRVPSHLKRSKINYFLLGNLVKKYLSDYKSIVIFSRSPIGYEIEFLKQRYAKRIVFYQDLRGAWPEEFLDTMKFNGSFDSSHFRILCDIYQACHKCQQQADKVFAVSNSLMRYYSRVYGTNPEKFVLYPCLSSSAKFYYDQSLRNQTREELAIKDEDTVFIYTGGLDYSYSFVKEFLTLVNTVYTNNSNTRLLVIAKSITKKFQELLEGFPGIKQNLITLESVPNEQMVKYLNAADYALLLRNNVPLNNVSSPVKFAEYQLCGLPVCISEAVTDYANYCQENNTGIVISNDEFERLDFSCCKALTNSSFNRQSIAEIAKKHLSKEMYVEKIVEELKF